MEKIIALGYSRVSTDLQKDNGVSLETQSKMIKEYCLRKEYELKKIYEDGGKSGGNLERDELKLLLNDITKGCYIIVTDLSRLSRDNCDTQNIRKEIEKKGAYLIMLDQEDLNIKTKNGKMLFGMKAVFNEYFRDEVSEKVSMNMKNLSKQNLLRSRPPFGYKFIAKELKYQKDEEQQEVINIIKEKYNTGYNYSQIAKYLNENKYNKYLKFKEKKNKENKEDKIFYAQTVRRIISNEGLIKINRKSLDERFLDSRHNKK